MTYDAINKKNQTNIYYWPEAKLMTVPTYREVSWQTCEPPLASLLATFIKEGDRRGQLAEKTNKSLTRPAAS